MAPTLTNQRERVEATRRKLLAAAARIFVRDGFEAARLEDIAARAGYTRGAFYANFESKEDLFLALLELWIGERVAELKSIFRRHKSSAGRRGALREYYTGLASDRSFALLSMEFKLFALRRAEARGRLRNRLRRLRASGSQLIAELLKARGRAIPISGRAASAGLGALSNALVIEHLVDSKALSNKDVGLMLRLFFDALIEGQTRK
jgi:AcrR family transcriptional regulator